MKRILVPCDFSTVAQEAFRFAIKIASASKGEVHVLHIIDIMLHGTDAGIAPGYAFNPAFVKDMEMDAESKFAKMWEKSSPLTLPVKFRHQIGALVQDVKKYIAEHDIDIVVIGTEGRSDHRASNTMSIVRNSPVPVFAIGKQEPTAIKKIVVPVLPHEPDATFIYQLKKLQQFFEAELHILWINTPQVFKPDADSIALLKQYIANNALANSSIQVRSDTNIVSGIRTFVKEIGGQLVAMRTHQWRGMAHLISGSNAEDLVGELTVPVWTCGSE